MEKMDPEPSLLLQTQWTSDKLIRSLHALFNKKTFVPLITEKIRKDKKGNPHIQIIEHFKNTPILYNASVLQSLYVIVTDVLRIMQLTI